MATKEKTSAPENVMQKLIAARQAFIDAHIEKSGKNMKLEFKYFELSDIVPTATAIFKQLGLIKVDNFVGDEATATIYNVDNMEEEPFVFHAPFCRLDPIISNQGKEVTNRMQSLGSSITYMRRYLWMIVLDIVEQDSIDPMLTGDDEPEEQPKKSAPKTTEERKAIKDKMVAPSEGVASAESVTALKSVLKELMAVDPEQESFVQEVALKTEGFSKLTEEKCLGLIEGVKDMLNGYTK